MPEIVQPPGWPRPRGYANGMIATGRLLAIGGQVGARPGAPLERGFVAQFAAAVDNVVAVVAAAGGQPTDVVSLTLFVTDQHAYHTATKEIREVWRARFHDHYPAMALVEVKGLIEPEALVEIQGLAVLP